MIFSEDWLNAKKDAYHDIVVRALIKANWRILKEQQYLSIGTIDDNIQRLYIDIKAQHQDNQIVLIEVKGLANSPIHDLMQLVGQYLVYRAALDYLENDTPLYIAIPDALYRIILGNPPGRQVIEKAAIPFVIYDPVKEELLQWIPPL